MPYEILERQIKALPEAAVLEVARYVGYLSSIYASGEKEKAVSVTEKINDFFAGGESEFDEFAALQKNGLAQIRELTKNDAW